MSRDEYISGEIQLINSSRELKFRFHFKFASDVMSAHFQEILKII